MREIHQEYKKKCTLFTKLPYQFKEPPWTVIFRLLAAVSIQNLFTGDFDYMREEKSETHG